MNDQRMNDLVDVLGDNFSKVRCFVVRNQLNCLDLSIIPNNGKPGN